MITVNKTIQGLPLRKGRHYLYAEIRTAAKLRMQIRYNRFLRTVASNLPALCFPDIEGTLYHFGPP